MKLTLLNAKNQPIVTEDNKCYMYWTCSLYEYDSNNIALRKYVGFSGNYDIIHKTFKMSLSMKSHNNIIGTPIITLHQFNTKQNEYVYMKSI